MNSYINDPLTIIHKVSVDFIERAINDRIHIVQYDDRLRVIEVHLYLNKLVYHAPSNNNCYIRFGTNFDNTYRIAADSFNSDRSIVYFVITKELTTQISEREYTTKGTAVVELSNDSSMVCSSNFDILIDRNPVQE